VGIRGAPPPAGTGGGVEGGDWMRRTVQQEVEKPQAYSDARVRTLKSYSEAMGATDFGYFLMGECSVIVGREPCAMSTTPIIASLSDPPMRWHMSIACPDRYPTWDEMMMARTHILPADLAFAQIFPGSWDEFINLHSNCFHLWEVHDKEV